MTAPKLAAAGLLLAAAVAAVPAAPVPPGEGKLPNANAEQCDRTADKLRQLALAIHAFHDVNGRLPSDVTDKDGKPLLSWRIEILPYVEETPLYKAFRRDEPWDSEHNKQLLAKMPDVFRNGTEKKDETRTYFQGYAGPGAVFERGVRVTLLGITDGTANTLLLAEAGPPVEWAKPADIAYDPKKPLTKRVGPFGNVFNFVTADGTTHTLRPDLDETTTRRLIERADGHPIPDLRTLRVTPDR
jgi:hypothetical protein